MVEQPRTLLISPFFDMGLPSGGVLYSVNVAREWLSRGRRVAVLCGRRERRLAPLQSYVDAGQLTLHPIASDEQIRFSHHIHPDVADAARDAIQALKPDLVHVHNFQGMLGAVQAAVDSPVPVILTALDLGLLCFNFCLYDGTVTPCPGPTSPQACARCIRGTIHGLTRWLGPILPRAITRALWPRFVRLDQIQSMAELQAHCRSILRSLDAIIAPSPITAEKLQEFGAPPGRVTQILYGLAPGMMVRPAKTASETLRLAYLGGAERVKGFQVIAEAARLLPDGLPLEIRVFGGDRMRAKIERSAPRARRYLRYQASIFGPSWVTEHARIDAIVVPSLCHENSPLVVLEALANGTAILAADQAGIRHLIEPGRTGRLIPPGDAPAWAEAMTRAAREPADLRRMQANTRFARTIADFVDDLECIELLHLPSPAGRGNEWPPPSRSGSSTSRML